MSVIQAPFTVEQVAALNRWQASRWVHPFTCGGEHRQHVNLVATQSGWVCPIRRCDYTQDWAHDFMTRDAPNPFAHLEREDES